MGKSAPPPPPERDKRPQPPPLKKADSGPAPTPPPPPPQSASKPAAKSTSHKSPPPAPQSSDVPVPPPPPGGAADENTPATSGAAPPLPGERSPAAQPPTTASAEKRSTAQPPAPPAPANRPQSTQAPSKSPAKGAAASKSAASAPAPQPPPPPPTHLKGEGGEGEATGSRRASASSAAAPAKQRSASSKRAMPKPPPADRQAADQTAPLDQTQPAQTQPTRTAPSQAGSDQPASKQPENAEPASDDQEVASQKSASQKSAVQKTAGRKEKDATNSPTAGDSAIRRSAEGDSAKSRSAKSRSTKDASADRRPAARDTAPKDSAAVPPPPPASKSAAASSAAESPARPPTIASSTSSRAAPPPASEIDPRLESFLQRAAPILSAERGINARSRVLLNAVARDVGISDEEFEEAVKALQHGRGGDESKAGDPAVDAFYRYLHARLEKFNGILTLDLQNKAVQVAADKFQVAEAAARQAVAEVAGELGVKRITTADAERHVVNLIEQKVGDSAWLDDETTGRLRAVGKEWGLNTLEVDAIIRKHMLRNREAQRHEHRFAAAAIWAAAAVVILLVGFFVWAFALRPLGGGDGETPVAEAPVETSGDDAATPAASAERPRLDEPAKWWDHNLTLAQLKARRTVDGFDPVYRGISSPDAEERGKAYADLVAVTGRLWGDDDKANRDLLQEIIVACYAKEPSDEAAARLRESLLALTTPQQETLPESADIYKQANWAVRTATWAFSRADVSDKRADELAVDLGRKIGTTIDRTAPRTEVTRQAAAAVVAYVYQSLTMLGPASPLHALHLQQAFLAEIKSFGEQYVGVDLLDKLRTNFLVAVVPAAGDRWRDFKQLIDDCINSDSPLNALKVLELYERSDDLTLQSYVGARLLERVEMRPDSTDVASVSATVRKALGVAAPPPVVTAGDRWKELADRSETPLGRTPAAPTNQKQLLEETVELAWLATLGNALAQKEAGLTQFDQLVEAGRPPLESIKDEDAPEKEPRRSRVGFAATGPPPQALVDDMNRHFDNLARFQQRNFLQRQNSLRGLARNCERMPRIEPEQGAVVARYLLADKSEGEHAAALESVEEVSRWYYVRLGLADLIASSPLEDKFAAEVISKALGRTVSTGTPNWRAAAREQLLQDVLLELQATARPLAAAPASPLLDVAEEVLRRIYRQRARQLLVEDAAIDSAATPSEVLNLLVAKTQSRLAGADGGWAPQRLEVIDYLAQDDLDRTVGLQRVWLQLLAAELRKQGSPRAGAADELVRQLEQRDARAAHILSQLRDGEETTLRMLLLHAPPGT